MKSVMKVGVAIAALFCIAASFAYPNIGLYWITNADPSIAPGINAPGYQLAIRTDDPSIWYKSGNTVTSWTRIGAGSMSVNPTLAGADLYFGTGIDGDLNFDGVNPVTIGGTAVVPAAGVYTLAGYDVKANNIAIASGAAIRTNGRSVQAQGTITGPGKIQWNGNAASTTTGGGAMSSYVTPGALAGLNGALGGGGSPAARTNMYYWCTNIVGGNGGGTSVAVVNPGANGTPCRGGGGGGTGTVGGGGSASNITKSAGDDIFLNPLIGWYGRAFSTSLYDDQSPGGNGTGNGGTAGGGAGVGGGWVTVLARNCGTGNWSVEAKGGDGGTPVCGGNPCSGGGGGPGGTIWMFCGQGTAPTTDNTPGTGGFASNGNAGSPSGSCVGLFCPGRGGCGGTGKKFVFSPSTGWTVSADPVLPGC
jgi:hypothetical protein